MHIWLISLPPSQLTLARRSLLAQYLNIYLSESTDQRQFTLNQFTDPEHSKPGDQPLTLAIGDGGKPYLPQAHLEFNWSHSGSLALLAVTRLAPLGIDLEILRTCRRRQAIARRFFSPESQSFLALASPEQADQRFLYLWTRYEAEMKAHGHGIFTKTNRATSSYPEAGTPADHFYIYSFQALPQTMASLVILTPETPELLFFDGRSPEFQASNDRPLKLNHGRELL